MSACSEHEQTNTLKGVCSVRSFCSRPDRPEPVRTLFGFVRKCSECSFLADLNLKRRNSKFTP